MNPPRYRQIEEIYNSAAARTPEERMSFLDEACKGDPALRNEVQSLLLHGDSPCALLDQRGWWAQDASQLTPGSLLGPYEILDRIGAGGMGEVYKARDTRLLRTVAVKTGGGRFSERFERETRAIAALNHPHICQIYDVGPNFLVMEYIAGRPIKGPLPLFEMGFRIVYHEIRADDLDGALAIAIESSRTVHLNVNVTTFAAIRFNAIKNPRNIAAVETRLV